jgi:hypothetical protein
MHIISYEIKSLDDAPEWAREHYIKTKTGYRLEITGVETHEELRAAKDAARDGKNAATARIRELEEQAEEQALQNEYAEARRLADPKPIVQPERHPDDIRLEKEFTDKLAAHEDGLKAQVASLRSDRDSTALERTAVEVASKLAIAGSHELLLPHIRARLAVSDANGVFAVTAKDAPSIEHLVEQFRADPRFSRVLNGMSTVDKAQHQRRVDETLGITAPASVTRAAFQAMTAPERAAYAREGGKIADA